MKHTETEYKVYVLRLRTSDYSVRVVWKSFTDVLSYYDEEEVTSLEELNECYLSEWVIKDILSDNIKQS